MEDSALTVASVIPDSINVDELFDERLSLIQIMKNLKPEWDSLPKDETPKTQEKCKQVFEAFSRSNVSFVNIFKIVEFAMCLPGVEMQCIGHFRLLFALLSAESCKDVQRGALEVIATVTRNHECVNDIAASDILVHLVVVLYTLPDHQVTILDILYALMSTTKIVKEALAKGLWIYELMCFHLGLSSSIWRSGFESRSGILMVFHTSSTQMWRETKYSAQGNKKQGSCGGGADVEVRFVF
uniref:Uncharacterized protein n=1 Tax=Timema poppense TaxID=170557 RepID=A0A7R9CU66_TIMPO|nr:unnamed protein product [Timema poppensis]